MARFEMQCTEEEKELWVEEARIAGMSLAKWIRRMIGIAREKLESPVLAEGEVGPDQHFREEIARLKKELERVKSLPAKIEHGPPRRVPFISTHSAGPFPENETVKQAKQYLSENGPKAVSLCPRCERIGKASCEGCKKKAGMR